MRPLGEVQAHIEAHGHLPEVPTAAEVAEQGVDVGQRNAAQMHKVLLQKVEELTLYLLDQQDRLEAQAAEIEQLKAQLK